MNGPKKVTNGGGFATGGTGRTGVASANPRRQPDSSLNAARERFLAGEDVSRGVRPEILLSWYRCRDDYKVDPFRERAPSAPVDGPGHSFDDDVVVAELGGLAKSIEPDVEAIDGIVAITDGRGRVLAAWGDRQTLAQVDDLNLAPWCAWSEEGAGTNGMGTALTSEGAIFIRGAEHWCSGFQDLECAGVAVRDPVTNQPLGALDISSNRRPLPDAVLTWLKRAQQKIEAGLRERAIRSFCDLVTVYRDSEREARGPLAAVDSGGRLLLANAEAQRLFGVARPDPPRELKPDLPQLAEAVRKALDHARRDRLWVGVAHIYVPSVGSKVPVAFRPAERRSHAGPIGGHWRGPAVSEVREAEPTPGTKMCPQGGSMSPSPVSTGTVPTDADYEAHLARLNRLSVDKHTHAYELDWDSPEYAFEPADPRLELPVFDPLAQTLWYRSQPPEVRSRLALYRYAACMKVGWHFENLLQRGLLKYVMTLPNGAPEFRYLHHEVIEESEHTLMFQEFVNRTGLPVRGMPRSLRLLAEVVVVPTARWFPALFFLFVLGGEDPVDDLQRRQLRDRDPMHPLVEKIMRVHVSEEARHLSFARKYLTREVPKLGRLRRLRLRIAGPVVMAVMARVMLFPPGDMARHFDIPDDVMREAIRSPQALETLAHSVAKTRRLWVELGLVGPLTRRLWKAAGLWADDAADDEVEVVA